MAPIIDPITGKHLANVAQKMIAKANLKNEEVFETFNRIELCARPGSTSEAVINLYQEKYIEQPADQGKRVDRSADYEEAVYTPFIVG